MENSKKINWKVILNLIMAILLVVCLVKLNNLTDEVNNLQSQLSYWQSDVNNIRNDISSIYNNVDEHLKKEKRKIPRGTQQRRFIPWVSMIKRGIY